MATLMLVQFGLSAQSKVAADSVEFYLNNSQYLHGLEYAKKRSAYYLKQKRYFAFSKMTVRESDVLLTLNDNQKTLKVLLDALKIVEKRNEKTSEIVLMQKLGNVYVKLNQFEHAKKYYYSAITQARKIKNDSLIGRLAQQLYRIHYNTNSDS